MKIPARIAIGSAAFVFLASPVEAQWFSLGLRGSGSVPTGAFADDAVSPTSVLSFDLGLAVHTPFGSLLR